VCFITESISAIDSKYQQIQITDDDVSIIQVCEMKLSRCKTTFNIFVMIYHYHFVEVKVILSGMFFFCVV